MLKMPILLALACQFHLPPGAGCATINPATDTASFKSAILRYEEFTGMVVKIVDGDTYDLLLDNKMTIRIRMNGIDAPEKGQAFYQKAKDFLGSMCFEKKIRIVILNKDRYGRTIAESYLENGLSLSNEMVRNGYAWQFKKYSKDRNLAALEDAARTQRLGLWADEHPEEPGAFRAEKKGRLKAAPTE